jgi:hypothetical protein
VSAPIAAVAASIALAAISKLRRTFLVELVMAIAPRTTEHASTVILARNARMRNSAGPLRRLPERCASAAVLQSRCLRSWEAAIRARTCCVILLGLANAVSARPAAEAPALDVTNVITKVRLTAERIEYSGIITHEANAGVFELYESADPRPQALLIESQGGSADAGMQLGRWLHEHDLQVQIDTYCFSSCANYVFPSGSSRLLAPHASLMWHGGVTQPITPQELAGVLDETLAGLSREERQQLLREHPRKELMQQLRQSLIELVASETRFFREIGVDQRITTLGHRYERELLAGQGRYMGWDFSIEDLQRLGIRAIEVKDGAAWEPVFPVRGQQIYRIRLDRLPDFHPNDAVESSREKLSDAPDIGGATLPSTL